MKRIVFNLKREWYDKIASGEKTVEYRRICDHWMKRFEIFPSILQDLRDGAVMSLLPDGYWIGDEWYAVFRLGYSRKYPDIVRRIKEIDIGTCPYPGWSGEYFRIHFAGEGGERSAMKDPFDFSFAKVSDDDFDRPLRISDYNALHRKSLCSREGMQSLLQTAVNAALENLMSWERVAKANGFSVKVITDIGCGVPVPHISDDGQVRFVQQYGAAVVDDDAQNRER